VGPFCEFDFGFDFGAQPGVGGHFFGGHSLTPPERNRLDRIQGTFKYSIELC
jgi:hypothetical protein